ncbi:PaaI family thioesterase [Desertibacillus haloalkaliphilus]|uniref:PaaI family thioesterase n=1 Tax=Desertibacillus haloalkaliphilus TaxID=1328930 RepID=UPI001C26510F|nr:PaaI family thioesterase [Desertibacillus haloalkaliphilus]MBU8906090.1 PaaI family thioesterase [Desertibacillus haloalkaliphilus]
MSKTIQELKTNFETSSFFTHLGFEIVRCDEEEIILKLPIQEHLINTNQTVHGGVYATMLDNIISMVVRSAVKAPIVTVSLNIHYLAPAKEGYLLAKAKVLQQGYRIVAGEGEIYDQDNRLLAKGNGTFKVNRPK